MGNNTYSISCTGDGGNASSSITIEGYRNTDGVVVDGYISGAEVFIDKDSDWMAGSNESSTTSELAPNLETRAGVPKLIASKTLFPNPSNQEGMINKSDL